MIQGIGRTVFEVDRLSGTCRPLFKLPQLLDYDVLRTSWAEQSAWTKSFTRGLRAITPLADGGFVVNDIFGIYDVDAAGVVRRYLTLPCFADLHCALPNSDNSRLLVTSTGTEEVLEVDWNGEILRRIHLPTLFGLPCSPQVEEAKKANADHRTMMLSHDRELFHVNWATWQEEGKSIMVSLHAPGMIATIHVNGQTTARLGDRWSYFPHCHGPTIDSDRQTLLVAVSKANEVREVCLNTGKTLWITKNIRYGKRVCVVSDRLAVACDCNGRRLVEIDRVSGSIVWSCDLPGIPYDVAMI